MSSNVCDFNEYKRRRDAGLRLPPLDSGRRDPDARPAFDPAPEPHVLDHQAGDVNHLEVLRKLHARPALTDADRAALVRVGLILRHLADEAGEVAA